MIGDLTTLDALIQRLGRVNRRGGNGRAAQIRIVIQAADQDRTTKHDDPILGEALKETSAVLQRWIDSAGGTLNVSPRNLQQLLASLSPSERKQAFAPKPTILPLTDILLDTWALTTPTTPLPGQPEVAAYLHGLEQGRSETFVAWRQEVTLLAEAKLDAGTVAEWFQACRIEGRERLRDRTERVKRVLRELLKTHRTKKGEQVDFPVVVLNERGEAEGIHGEHGEVHWPSLSEIVEQDFRLDFRTVVLPVEAGGLDKHGTLTAGQISPVQDVADAPTDNRRERWLERSGLDGAPYQRLSASTEEDTLPADLVEQMRITLEEPAEDTGKGGRWLLLLTERRQSTLERAEATRTNQNQLLDDHLKMTKQWAERIADALGLTGSLRDALARAAAWHDRGKDRPIWQWYACNYPSRQCLAKSQRYRDGRALGGYRHEFGSLVDAAVADEIRQHSEADLILHLIATHHGWARPHFERNAWDNHHNGGTTEEHARMAVDVLRRYSRLQRRFGRWGLAWLEALLRCADIAASTENRQPDVVVVQNREVDR
jgi:CRISPR-associated endonuclease/helicase Cas3